ncbi:MAG: hypothetical protein NZ840_03305 [Anaerolineales bacterium]|nr:hypothetical protein [Anaerolineales bacterium]MDW8161060.1 hypothetical protein [Anaerolineales bacterium]
MKSKRLISLFFFVGISILSFLGMELINPRVVLAYSGHPYFFILSVSPDETVTIRAHNFPPNDTFKVMMNKMGTKGVNGIVVDTISTGAGGTFTATFSIPDALKGQRRIAIRLQSTTGSGYFAYNWFYNAPAKSGTGDSSTGYKGFPIITVTKVVKDKYILLKMSNLPKNDQFKVLMGKLGTRGVKGVEVDSFSTGDGGTQTIKVKIPKSLKGLSAIAVRIQSTSGSGYFSYNWFYNR